MNRKEILESIWGDVEHLFKACFADFEGIGHAKKNLLEMWSDLMDEETEDFPDSPRG